MGNRAGHHSDGTEDTLEGMTDITVREVLPWAVDQAPCITFAQVRALAMHQGLTLRDLVAQFQNSRRRWSRRVRCSLGCGTRASAP
jgi:hypothetical protein